MRIEIATVDESGRPTGDPQVIAGKDNRESVTGFDSTGGPIIQKSMPLRAAQPKWRNRGGESQDQTFEVCRKHDSIPEAGLFCIEHMGALTKTGMITFSEEYGGKKIVRRALGVLKRTGCRMKGQSTFVRYELEIGAVTIPR